MKKTLFFLGFLFLSCGGNKKIQEVTMEKSSSRYYEVPATRVGISKGVKPVTGPITKQELEGASVSFFGGEFQITPESRVQKEVGHDENGAIIRQIQVDGGNAIKVPEGKGGRIVSADYQNGIYPTTIVVEIPGQSGTANVSFVLNPMDGKYYPFLDKENGKFVQSQAGYRFTDPVSGKHAYLNNPRISLGKIFFRQEVFDGRSIEEGGVPLPQ